MSKFRVSQTFPFHFLDRRLSQAPQTNVIPFWTQFQQLKKPIYNHSIQDHKLCSSWYHLTLQSLWPMATSCGRIHSGEYAGALNISLPARGSQMHHNVWWSWCSYLRLMHADGISEQYKKVFSSPVVGEPLQAIHEFQCRSTWGSCMVSLVLSLGDKAWKTRCMVVSSTAYE